MKDPRQKGTYLKQAVNIQADWCHEKKCEPYVVFTQLAAEAWHTLTLEMVQPVQTGSAIEARIRFTLVYLRLAPEKHQQGLTQC